MTRLTGWRYAAFVGSLVGAILLTIYPTIIHPVMNIEEYKKQQQTSRLHLRNVYTDSEKSSDDHS